MQYRRTLDRLAERMSTHPSALRETGEKLPWDAQVGVNSTVFENDGLIAFSGRPSSYDRLPMIHGRVGKRNCCVECLAAAVETIVAGEIVHRQKMTSLSKMGICDNTLDASGAVLIDVDSEWHVTRELRSIRGYVL